MVRKLFLTPDSLPTETICRSLEIPSSQAWLGIFNQALLQLTNEFNYEQVNETDLTPEETAAACYAAYVAWLSSECGAPVFAPTPFWDEDADVDDQETPETQTWYGTVPDPEADPAELDFVENFAIWAITGFLAVATWEIGAAPAILFSTVAPRFVLAVKRGDVGEIIRVLVDGEESARVDTSAYTAGDVIDIPIVADQSFSPHEVVIVQVS